MKIWVNCILTTLVGASVCASAEVVPFRTIKKKSCEKVENGKVKVAFFDADSTLRVSRSGKVSANGPRDVYVLPFAGEWVKKYHEQDYLIAIASNQNGVQFGHVSMKDAQAALRYTATLLTESIEGAYFDYIDMAPNNYDGDKKPKTGMAARLNKLLKKTCKAKIDVENSLMVGDAGYSIKKQKADPENYPKHYWDKRRKADDFSDSDRGFAENLGIEFYEPADKFDWRRFKIYNVHKKTDLDNLLIAIKRDAENTDHQKLKEIYDRYVETNNYRFGVPENIVCHLVGIGDKAHSVSTKPFASVTMRDDDEVKSVGALPVDVGYGFVFKLYSSIEKDTTSLEVLIDEVEIEQDTVKEFSCEFDLTKDEGKLCEKEIKMELGGKKKNIGKFYCERAK